MRWPNLWLLNLMAPRAAPTENARPHVSDIEAKGGFEAISIPDRYRMRLWLTPSER